MFYGTVPAKCIDQLFRVFDFKEWSAAYVCCSGSFRIERALRAKCPDLPIFSNDVSLYSTALGRLAAGETLAIQFVDRLEFIEGWLKGAEFSDRVAAMLVACEIARYGAGKENPYKKAHFDHYVSNFETFLDKARDRLTAVVPKMAIQGYFAGDWREHVETAIKAGAGVAAFPPFFKGDYEAQFRFVHENVEWPAPDYDLYDPNRLSSIVDGIHESGIQYCVLSDQVFEDREPVFEFRWGLKVPHYCYGRSDRSSLRHGTTVATPFRYDPVDISACRHDSKLQVYEANSKQANFIKDIYLDKSIVHSEGLRSFFVYIDKMLLGAIIYSLPKFAAYGPGAIYLLSDVTTTRDAKLSKLVAKLASSSVILSELDKKYLNRFDLVVTTARTTKPMSMKYRGIYRMMSRRPSDDGTGRNVIQYAVDRSSETPQQMYRWWWRKYGSAGVAAARDRDQNCRSEVA